MSKGTAPSESPGRAPVVALIGGCALVGYELLMHWAVVLQGGPALGPLLASLPLVFLALILLRRHPLAAVLSLGVLIAMWLVVAGIRPLEPALAAFYPLSSVAVYGSLFWMFARTLRPGREALATRLALQVHGTLPPDILRYTRRVTLAWSLFFAGMATISVLLFSFAPLRIWSLFANLLSLPLLVLMFVAEYVYRIRRFPDFEHVSLLATPRLFGRFRRGPTSGEHGG